MKKILVVDDDPAILEVIKIILEDNNYEVETSENGNFVENFNGINPDLILLDVLLSGEDGRDIARALKSQKNTREIPIVMISAHPNAYEGSLKSGADDFISKPFDIDHLLEVVDKNLKGSA